MLVYGKQLKLARKIHCQFGTVLTGAVVLLKRPVGRLGERDNRSVMINTMDRSENTLLISLFLEEKPHFVADFKLCGIVLALGGLFEHGKGVVLNQGLFQALEGLVLLHLLGDFLTPHP